MIPEEIDKKVKYDLSAIIFVDRFFYGLHQNGKIIFEQFISYKDNLDLSRKLKRAGLDKLKLEKIAVVSHLAPAGLIDYDEFDYENFHAYFADNYPGELLKIVDYFSNKLVGQKLFSTFALKRGLKKVIDGIFPNCEYFHITKVLSDYLIKKKSDSVLMLLSETSLSIVSVEDGVTVFSNIFRVTGEMDAAYYVKSLYDELGYGSSKPCYIIDSHANKSHIQKFQDHFTNCTVIPTNNLELIEALECVS